MIAPGRRAGASIALALGLAACSAEPDRPFPVADRPLPDAASLPHRYNQDCGCVVENRCVVVEERFGRWELRNLTCRWVTRNRLAECRFGERFIGEYIRGDGSVAQYPGAWSDRVLRARLLENGQWCED